MSQSSAACCGLLAHVDWCGPLLLLPTARAIRGTSINGASSGVNDPRQFIYTCVPVIGLSPVVLCCCHRGFQPVCAQLEQVSTVPFQAGRFEWDVSKLCSCISFFVSCLRGPRMESVLQQHCVGICCPGVWALFALCVMMVPFDRQRSIMCWLKTTCMHL